MPPRQQKVWGGQLCGPAEMDLGNGLVKALKGRVEAWEGKKWDEVRRDWEALVGIRRARGLGARLLERLGGVEGWSTPEPA